MDIRIYLSIYFQPCTKPKGDFMNLFFKSSLMIFCLVYSSFSKAEFLDCRDFKIINVYLESSVDSMTKFSKPKSQDLSKLADEIKNVGSRFSEKFDNWALNKFDCIGVSAEPTASMPQGLFAYVFVPRQPNLSLKEKVDDSRRILILVQGGAAEFANKSRKSLCFTVAYKDDSGIIFLDDKKMPSPKAVASCPL